MDFVSSSSPPSLRFPDLVPGTWYSVTHPEYTPPRNDVVEYVGPCEGTPPIGLFKTTTGALGECDSRRCVRGPVVKQASGDLVLSPGWRREYTQFAELVPGDLYSVWNHLTFQADILEYVGLRKGTGPHYKFKYPRGTPFVCDTEHTVTGPLSRSDLPPAEQDLLRRREALPAGALSGADLVVGNRYRLLSFDLKEEFEGEFTGREERSVLYNGRHSTIRLCGFVDKEGVTRTIQQSQLKPPERRGHWYCFGPTA